MIGIIVETITHYHMRPLPDLFPSSFVALIQGSNARAFHASRAGAAIAGASPAGVSHTNLTAKYTIGELVFITSTKGWGLEMLVVVVVVVVKGNKIGSLIHR